MPTILFGMSALIILVLSCYSMYNKKHVWSLITGILSEFFIVLTGYNWKVLLEISGKDTTLLGFYRYPAAVIILAALSVLALVLIILNAIHIYQRCKKGSHAR